jgi:molecular chaperone GrpE
MAGKNSKKKPPENGEADEEFLESMEHLDELEPELEESGSEDEEFDFDGSDVDLDSIPSWIDEEPNAPSSRKKSFDDALDETPESTEGFTLDEAEDFLAEDDMTISPDASDLFKSETSADVAALTEQRDAYLEALRQLQADFENYKKRVIRDQTEDAEIKSAKLMEELLPIVDNFQLALASIEGDSKEVKKLRKGIELVYAEFLGVLEKQGLEKIEAEGALFDPELHDAVSHEDNGEHDQEIVTEVLREGYKVRGRVVRPAMVKVAK